MWEAYDVYEGARGGKFPTWRTAEYYIEEAKRRFESCKALGIIPESASWDSPIGLGDSNR